MNKPILNYAITKIEDVEYITITSIHGRSQKDGFTNIKATVREHELECYVVNDIIFCTRPQFAMIYLHFGDTFDFIEK